MDENQSGKSLAGGAEGGNASPAFALAIKRLLKPLVRLLLGRGIAYPYLIQQLKAIYVEVAAQEFTLAGKRQTDSRLSLLTGVHRKDVRRLARAPADPDAVPENVSLGARLVARWCAEAAYLDAQGQPKPLPRLASADRGVSFEGLVEEISKDIRARAVLDEWCRLGIVDIDANDFVHLRASAFVPAHGADEKAFYLGLHLHDHMAAVAHNMMDRQPPFLERSVYYDRLSPAGVAELAALSERLGMDALRQVNRRALELQAQTDGDTSAVDQRMTFGIYFFNEAVAANAKDQAHADQP
jgi:hypothetical protein